MTNKCGASAFNATRPVSSFFRGRASAWSRVKRLKAFLTLNAMVFISHIKRSASSFNLFSFGWFRPRATVFWSSMSFVLGALAPTAQADPLVVYSFTNNAAPLGSVPDYVAPGISADWLYASWVGGDWSTGVVTNFHGLTDNLYYTNHFDGKGYEVPVSELSTSLSSTANFAFLEINPPAGSTLTITNVRVDFGFDTALANNADTGARYRLFISRDGAPFAPASGILSTPNPTNQMYPGYTVLNDLTVVTNVSGATNSVRFRLAFGHNGQGAGFSSKYLFFDDIVVSGSIVPPRFWLTVEDEIAYEADSNHLAVFSISRTNTLGAVDVAYGIEPGDLTTGAALGSWLTNGAAMVRWDYLAPRPSPIHFSNGVATQMILIHPRPYPPAAAMNLPPWVDSWVEWAEPPETITVHLLSNANYIIAGSNSAVATLYDDDLPSLTPCFRDDFNTTDSATNWSATNWTIISQVDTSAVPIVEYGFDYSGIISNSPPGNVDTDTFGLKLALSSTDPAAYGVLNLVRASSPCCSTRYLIDFYLYLQYDGDQADPLGPPPWYALAGINGSVTSTNYVWFDPYAPNPGVGGSGQFVTVSANAATNPDFGGVHLWSAADNDTNSVAGLPPGSTMTQLLNNPPYGEVGGVAGVFGCDADSPTKTWLRCQLLRLDDLVRFYVNGYPVVETNITGMPGCAAALKPLPAMLTAANGSTEDPPKRIGAGGMTSLTNAENYAIFENYTSYDLTDNAAFTGVALDGEIIYFTFYSHMDPDYNPNSFGFEISTDFPNFQWVDVARDIPTKDPEGHFYGTWVDGVYIVREFLGSEHAVFRITNSP